MTSEEKMRAEFEEWFAREKADKIGSMTLMITREIMYEGWKASRESLVIELPRKEKDMAWMDDYDSGCVYGRNEVIESCKYAIHAAGVKTK